MSDKINIYISALKYSCEDHLSKSEGKCDGCIFYNSCQKIQEEYQKTPKQFTQEECNKLGVISI